MARSFQVLLHVLWFALLTLLTQIGGLVWLVALILGGLLGRRWPIRGLPLVSFLVLYALCTTLIVPPLARLNGRTPLPVTGNRHLRPESLWFAALNRHYVRPGLRRVLEDVAEAMQDSFPGTVVWYLDANFPFLDGYPLEPHFSHRDGKKIDLSIYWSEASSGEPVPGNPSPFGYGLYARPLPGEFDWSAECKRRGNRLVDFDGVLASPFVQEARYRFDADRTRELLRLLAEHESVRRVFIQPHLEERLGLSEYGKLRFQGCRAARHDDHAHVESE